MPNDRYTPAPLAGSLNRAPACGRCIGADHAIFELEEAANYRVGQTAFVRVNGVAMTGTVDRVDHGDGAVIVA
ncbi:hypothetical protein A6A40_23315 (plasmid) [Azospirillum humicireducens]|uniref:Uncharacterized protein n=1 Tax=Azospirillum humicireducens TaxID=1226968 RepID=A0A2R4VU62_9PROT|nr:hypothetical protein A6A40_23315 [Azospirillum humicireducens]